MASDPIKCLAAAHLPLTKRKKEDADWFERVNKLAEDVREIERAAARQAVLATVERLRTWWHAPSKGVSSLNLEDQLDAIERDAKEGMDHGSR